MIPGAEVGSDDVPVDASPSVAKARTIVQHILTILGESKDIWPLASRWHAHLEEFYKSRNGMTKVQEFGMADSVRPSKCHCQLAKLIGFAERSNSPTSS